VGVTIVTHQLTSAALAELDQWEAGGRAAITNVVAKAVDHLADGHSPGVVAHNLAHSAYETDPERVASGFAWAIVALAEQARAQVRAAAQLQPVVEHGIHMAGGGKLVRFEAPEIERIFPLADWIKANQAGGGKVSTRTVIVVEDWREVPR
jgi:hypothetical protein